MNDYDVIVLGTGGRTHRRHQSLKRHDSRRGWRRPAGGGKLSKRARGRCNTDARRPSLVRKPADAPWGG